MENIVNKEGYYKYIKYFENNSIETFYEEYDNLDDDIKLYQFGMELILPRKVFEDQIEKVCQKLKSISFLKTLNENIKSNELTEATVLLSSIESELKPVDIDNLSNQLAIIFMTTKELVSIRLKQIKYIRKVEHKLSKKKNEDV